jgi:hypothetical protein
VLAEVLREGPDRQPALGAFHGSELRGLLRPQKTADRKTADRTADRRPQTAENLFWTLSWQCRVAKDQNGIEFFFLQNVSKS